MWCGSLWSSFNTSEILCKGECVMAVHCKMNDVESKRKHKFLTISICIIQCLGSQTHWIKMHILFSCFCPVQICSKSTLFIICLVLFYPPLLLGAHNAIYHAPFLHFISKTAALWGRQGWVTGAWSPGKICGRMGIWTRASQFSVVVMSNRL